MTRIILFRYHHQFERNKALLQFYKYLNPGVKIYGLYGGPAELFQKATEILEGIIEHNYMLRHPNPDWNWKNSDMSYQIWYRDFGHTIAFDFMHSIEWDLLLFEPLDTLFAHVEKNQLALTGLIPLSKIEHRWYWSSNPVKRKEWIELQEHFRKNFQYNDKPLAMIGPATTFPRAFLSKIKDIEIPDLSNDELRIPLLAQATGFPMVDTGFFRKWFSKREFKLFNANAFIIDLKDIRTELSYARGRRAFHPCNQDLSFAELKDLHALTFLNKKRFSLRTLTMS